MNTPENWYNKPLSTVIFDIGDGGTPNTNRSEYFGGSVPWVVIQDIKKHISLTKTTLTELGLKSCSAKLWPAGTVILSTGATIGEVGIADVPLATKQGIHGIVCTDEISSEFLYYKLSTFRDFLKANAQGSTIREVRAPFIRTIPISFPSDKGEQTRIAAILSTLDRAIEQTEAIIAKQQRIKAGLMQDLLTKGIDEHGVIRSEATHKFKDSPLGRIPVEWDVSPAHSLCTAVIDCKNRTPPESKDGHPVIRTPNVRNGKFVTVDLAMTDPKSYEIWTARGEPQPSDVVITREAPFGEACLIPDNIGAPCLGQRMMMYKTDPQKLRSDFMVFAIYSERVQKRLVELAGGSTVGHIRVGDIRNLSIPHPKDVDEQEKIALTLTGIEQVITTLINNVNNLRLTKTGLMHDLLTGTVRVKLEQKNM